MSVLRDPVHGRAMRDSEGKELKDGSVVIDDFFGEGIAKGVVPLDRGDGFNILVQWRGTSQLGKPKSRGPEHLTLKGGMDGIRMGWRVGWNRMRARLPLHGRCTPARLSSRAPCTVQMASTIRRWQTFLSAKVQVCLCGCDRDTSWCKFAGAKRNGRCRWRTRAAKPLTVKLYRMYLYI